MMLVVIHKPISFPLSYFEHGWDVKPALVLVTISLEKAMYSRHLVRFSPIEIFRILSLLSKLSI